LQVLLAKFAGVSWRKRTGSDLHARKAPANSVACRLSNLISGNACSDSTAYDEALDEFDVLIGDGEAQGG
jgi:hypothetical protein